MTIPTRTFSYIPNSLAQSNQVNTNENTLYAWANGGIDDTNLNHAVGIYASTITANSAATSKFGTNPASTVGFQFIAPAANLTPLTVCGVGGQSASLFLVQATSGGQSLFSIGNTGGATILGSAGSSLAVSALTALSNPGLVAGDAIFQRGVSTGKILLGGATTAGALDFGITNAAAFSFSAGSVYIGAGGTYNQGTFWIPTAIAGNYSGLTTGNGGSQTVNTIVGTALCLVNSSVAAYITVDVSGNLGIAGTLHQTSLRSSKKNIADLSFSPLAVVVETNWQQYHLLGDDEEKQPHVGFIADESSEWLAGKTKDYMVPSDMAAIAGASVKELTLKLRAAGLPV